MVRMESNWVHLGDPNAPTNEATRKENHQCLILFMMTNWHTSKSHTNWIIMSPAKSFQGTSKSNVPIICFPKSFTASKNKKKKKTLSNSQTNKTCLANVNSIQQKQDREDPKPLDNMYVKLSNFHTLCIFESYRKCKKHKILSGQVFYGAK